MKRELILAGLLLLAFGIVAGMIRALDLIGAETLRTLALVLAVPGGIAVMALGFTPLVRAWRAPVTPPPERHVIRETRWHTVDHQRTAQPLPAVHPAALYPALQGTAWRAGLRGDGDPSLEETAWDVEPPGQAARLPAWDAWER